MAKGYMAHERETLEAVIAARNDAASVLEAISKAGAGGVEMGRVAFSRQGYNDSVTSYNTYRQSFPPVFFALRFGHPAAAELLEFVDSAQIRAAPQVEF